VLFFSLLLLFLVFFPFPPLEIFLPTPLVKPSIILAVLRRSVQRVCGAQLRITAPRQHSYLRKSRSSATAADVLDCVYQSRFDGSSVGSWNGCLTAKWLSLWLPVDCQEGLRCSNMIAFVDVKSGGEPFATLCKIWTFKRPAHEASELAAWPSRWWTCLGPHLRMTLL